MANPDGLSDGIVLADSQTDTQGIVDYGDPGGDDKKMVYAIGLSNDTVNVEYRPNENATWANVVQLSGSSAEVQTLHRVPEGQYRLNRNGNNADTITVALL